MTAYILRRLAYAIPTIIGVNLLTFVLFFMVNPLASQATKALGGKNVTTAKIKNYIKEKGYDNPRFYNAKESGTEKITKTIFYQKFVSLIFLDFGRSDNDGHLIGDRILERIVPSLCISVPALLFGLAINLLGAMLVAYYRGSYLDIWGVIVCIMLMSISGLYYIIGLQYELGRELRLIPVSGWGAGYDVWRFTIGPLAISLISGVGTGVRYYRTLFLEELNKDYIRTARSKGLSESRVVFGHGLRNALIPILTSVVTSLPFLIMGSLLLENFFAIPGLGNYMFEALTDKDFAIVRAMVFLGALLFIVGLILTDISYALVDPRISFSVGNQRLWTVYAGVLAFLLCLVFIGHITDPMRNGLDQAMANIDAAQAAEREKSAETKRCEEETRTRFSIYGSNLGAIILVGGFLSLLLYASRQEHWQLAWRQFRGNRLGMVALILLLLYVLIGAADSIAWRDPVRDAAGKVSTNRDGSVSLQPGARSIFDRVWLLAWNSFASRADGKPSTATRFSETWEKSYSAPLATESFQKYLNPDTGKRGHEPLLYPGAHLLGTDITGADTLRQCFKGIRTGLVLGLVTTLLALPFALFAGVLAGYFGGWVDDCVQYIYTSLASIPEILLIPAFILIFGQGLFQLCVVLGITGWVSLCRVLRGESMKLREMEYVVAARALGSNPFMLMLRHIVPNLMYIVLISSVLRFSGLVLAEAVFAYLGVGVGPNTGSWGNMINAAQMELSREPIVWWSLTGSFVFMFGMILAANIFADAVRDALDPRLRIR